MSLPPALPPPSELPRNWTVRETILVAIYLLGPVRTPLRDSRIAVAAWIVDPERFGLRGLRLKYPDSGAVRAKLAGADGVCDQKGWADRVTDGVYHLTDKGWLAARQLLALHPLPQEIRDHVVRVDSEYIEV